MLANSLLKSWFERTCTRLPKLRYGVLVGHDGDVVALFNTIEEKSLAAFKMSAELARVQNSTITSSEKGEVPSFTIAQPLSPVSQDTVAVFSFQGSLQQQRLAMVLIKTAITWLEWIAQNHRQVSSSKSAELPSWLSPLIYDGDHKTASHLCEDMAQELGLSSLLLVSRCGDRSQLKAVSGRSTHDAHLPEVEALLRRVDVSIGDHGRRDFSVELAEAEEKDCALCGVALNAPEDASSLWLVGFSSSIEAAGHAQEQLSIHKPLLRLLFADRSESNTSNTGGKVLNTLRSKCSSVRYGVLLAAILILLVPVDHRIKGEAMIQGDIQRSVIAPYDGFIEESYAKAGEEVVKGEVIARLESKDFRLELQQHETRLQELDRVYRQALADLNPIQSKIIKAQMAQVQADLELVRQKLARADLKSPLSGIIVSGDLSRSLGASVERGAPLFEVAPLKNYRAVLNVHQKDASYVRVGQQAQLVLTSMPGLDVTFLVQNIIPNFEAKSVDEAFYAYGTLEMSSTELRPGMNGTAKVTIAKRALGWVLFHELIDWWRLNIWAWLP